MVEKSSEEQKETISEEAYKDIVTNELERVGNGGAFVWMIFLLCVTPNILNGFHVASYTLLGHQPDDQWCNVHGLDSTNWTIEQRRTITQRLPAQKDSVDAKDLILNGCTVWNWDYTLLSQMSYEEALNYTTARIDAGQAPVEIACKAAGYYVFDTPESTFVADWELVCDRAIQRTSAQVMLSLGKFFGSFSFGIFADKFGRKAAFTLGSAFFIVSSFICTLSPWYSLFLVGRFGLGSASSGLFYPAFTMVVENICLKHRSWMSIVFAASYPIGMVFLAVAAYLVQPWRFLQLTLSIPALLLILNCYLLHESPRWLITKQYYDRAYKILFKKPSHYKLDKTVSTVSEVNVEKVPDADQSLSSWHRLRNGPLKQFIELFATWKVRKLILTSYFMFCVTSLSYYVTALNAANMSVSRYLYVAVTGIVDMPSYLVPVVMLKFTGRRLTTTALFVFTGVALLMVLVVPSDSVTWIVTFAMLGRFGISATYSVVTLYTAELYPTEIRNSALGTCSTWAHVGSISAPYVVDVLGLLGWYIPTTICGCCVLVAGLLTLSLPETGAGKLTDHVEEVPSDTETNLDTITKEKSIENDKY